MFFSPFEIGLGTAVVLFGMGLVGLMVRRNFLFILLSLEVMLNAAALLFIMGGSRWQLEHGQIMFILIISVAAAEASIGLALLLRLYQRFGSLNIDSISTMRG